MGDSMANKDTQIEMEIDELKNILKIKKQDLENILKNKFHNQQSIAMGYITSGIYHGFFGKKTKDLKNIIGGFHLLDNTPTKAEEISKFFGDAVYKNSIPRNVRLAESQSYGMPVYLYDKACSGAQSYLKLTEEMLTRNNDKFKKIKSKGKN